MTDFASTVSESVKQLGQAFLVAYYLPAFVFVLVHFYVLIPVWSGASAFVLPLPGDVDLTSLVGALLLPLVIGIVLVGLNSVLILIFEGRFWWLRQGLLYPLMRFSQKRREKLYKHLTGLQEEYRHVSDLLVRARTAEKQAQIRQQLAGLAQQLDEEHRKLEAKSPRQALPHAAYRVCPTSFGNAYAVAEEYAYERYGIDAVLFWPRLRELMHDSAANHSERITQQKTALDLSLNFVFLCGLLALEAMLTLRLGPTGHEGVLLLLALIAVVLCTSFYRSSVGAVSTMGELIKNSFDFHRGLILEAFSLPKPDELIVEQVVWVKLSAFIRRGDEFYLEDARAIAENRENITSR